MKQTAISKAHQLVNRLVGEGDTGREPVTIKVDTIEDFIFSQPFKAWMRENGITLEAGDRDRVGGGNPEIIYTGDADALRMMLRLWFNVDAKEATELYGLPAPSSTGVGRHETPNWLGRVPSGSAKDTLKKFRQGGFNPRAVYRDKSGKNRYARSGGPDWMQWKSGYSKKSDATHADIYHRAPSTRGLERQGG